MLIVVSLVNAKCDVILQVRERREKTRLRVARWRAKRKLQACLNQAQVSIGCSFNYQDEYVMIKITLPYSAIIPV